MKYLVGIALALSVTACSNREIQDDLSPTFTERPSAQTGSVREAMYDRLEQIAKCAADKGWEIEIDYLQYGYGIDFGTQENKEIARQVLDECELEAGPSPGEGAMTPERAAKLFDHYVKMRSCLVDLGYETSEPSSKATFIDLMMNIGPNTPAPWSPFADLPVDSMAQTEWHRILAKCPQDIDNELKYGAS